MGLHLAPTPRAASQPSCGVLAAPMDVALAEYDRTTYTHPRAALPSLLLLALSVQSLLAAVTLSSGSLSDEPRQPIVTLVSKRLTMGTELVMDPASATPSPTLIACEVAAFVKLAWAKVSTKRVRCQLEVCFSQLLRNVCVPAGMLQMVEISVESRSDTCARRPTASCVARDPWLPLRG